jgi:histidine triad (HIT) family protein
MHNHAPAGYQCPLCQLVEGADNPDPWTKQSDIFYRDADLLAFVNVKWWGSIKGNAIVMPNVHVENMFELDADLAGKIHEVAKEIGRAYLESFGSRGVSTRQHNGPAGNQDVWHYHLHVFPRSDRGDLYGAPTRLSSLAEREPYVERLRGWFER